MGASGRDWGRPLLAAIVLYVAYGLAVQHALVPVAATHVYGQDVPGNDSLLHVWTLAWGQHALATDPRHALDANIFHPHPSTLLYSDHLLGLAALLAPLRLATDNVVLVHNLLVLAAPILNALAMFVLVRDLTGRTSAALLGGFVYGFAPLRLHIDRTQIQMLAAWWLPLLLVFGRRTIVTGRARDAVGAGAALLGQGLSGIYLTAFFAPFLVLAHLMWARRLPFARHRRGWLRLLAAEGIAGLLLLPFALAYRTLQETLGTVRSPVLSGLLTIANSAYGPREYVPLATVLLLLAAGAFAWRRLPEALRGERSFFVVVSGGALLLAFGPALPLPFDWGRVWGPYGILMSLPGFTALRAPGRMVHIAVLGLAVLAAFGFLAVTAGVEPRRRRLAAAALLGLAAIECWTPSFDTMAAPPPAAMDPVYRWLATQGDDMRIVELPIDDYTRAAQTYQYASTGHWRKTLGGNMGLLPPVYPHMVRKLRRFPDRDVLADLRALGITHVVVHGRRLPAPVRVRLDERAHAARRWLKRRWEHDGTTVYAIRPGLRPSARPPTGPPLPRDGWRVTASHGAAFGSQAIDSDLSTSWSSWRDLETGLETRWYDPVSFAGRWREFLATQPVRLTIDLGAPHDVTGLDIRFAGTDPLAVPNVTVEWSLDGVTWQQLPEALEPLPDVRALVEHAAALRMGRRLARAIPLRYIRLSCEGFEWHVADLQLHGA